MVNIVRVSSSVGVPLSTPVEVLKARPLGTDGLMAHDTNSPEPEIVGASGRSSEAVLLVMSKSFGEYAIVGTSSTMVMLMYAVAVPPVLVAVMVNMLRVSNSVGVPLSTPVEASKERPLGSDGLMAQDTNAPEPVMVGESGRSSEAVLLVMFRSFGEYAIVGTSSTIVMLMYAVAVPPVFVAVIVYSARESSSVGVPLSTPVELLNARPLGTDLSLIHISEPTRPY